MLLIVKVKCLCGNSVRIRTNSVPIIKPCENCHRLVNLMYVHGRPIGIVDKADRPVDVEIARL
jgi:hypothetical protein